MAKLGIFLANGCEECEALTVVDLVRRAGLTIDMISIYEEEEVTSSHKVIFRTDTTIASADLDSYDGIILPGGMPGTLNLGANPDVVRTIKRFASEKKLVAAVCAAPTVLGENGLLEGRKATCYPGMEDKLTGARFVTDPVAVDGSIITSRGLGTTIPFAAAIIAHFLGQEKADAVLSQIVYNL